MSEYYLSVKISSEDTATLEKLKAILIEGDKNHGKESGETLKKTLAEFFSREFSDFIFTPFCSDADLQSILPYISNKRSAAQYWNLQQAICKNKKHLWLHDTATEIVGYDIFPEKVKFSKDKKKLILEYPCSVEQMLITSAFLTKAFSLLNLDTKSTDEGLFLEDEH